jgi:hypothetical protein
MKACLPRSASGEKVVTRSLAAPSTTATTTPASSRRRVLTAPAASDRVSAMPPSAPTKAAPTRPTRSIQASVARLSVKPPALAVAITSTTARPAPAAVPSR